MYFYTFIIPLQVILEYADVCCSILFVFCFVNNIQI